MRIRRSMMVLSLLTLALALAPAAFAGEMCKAPQQASLHGAPATPLSACSAWVETTYYSSSSETTQVGRCTITCHQFDTGDAEPLFGEGGTCTGSPSAWFSQYWTACPCPP